MKKGQGLLETIVALGIIMTGLMSTITLVISNLRAERDSASRLIAVNLAREGIEIVRAIRDTNWLEGEGAWDDIITSTSPRIAVPIINPSTDSAMLSLENASDSLENAIIYKYPDNIYTQDATGAASDSWPATKYRRLLTISKIICEDSDSGLIPIQCGDVDLSDTDTVGVTIRSQVQWQESGQTKNIEIIEKLYDWR